MKLFIIIFVKSICTPSHIVTMVICPGNIPWLFAIGICRSYLPWHFAVGICRSYLPWEFAAAICRGFLPWVFVWLFAVGLFFVCKQTFFLCEWIFFLCKRTFLNWKQTCFIWEQNFFSSMRISFLTVFFLFLPWQLWATVDKPLTV